MSYSAEQIEKIARSCHKVNTEYCKALGDFSQPEWDVLSDNLKSSVKAGVLHALMNPDITPEDSHRVWVKFKADEGYVYGVEKDHIKKTHPCMLPYTALPVEQRAKDFIFKAVVNSFSKEVIGGSTKD